mgnify:CR=1 FL=1
MVHELPEIQRQAFVTAMETAVALARAEGANMGLSCGNPTALAALQPGEIVVDLGSGAGQDCYLLSQLVGEHGHVVDVDMTPEQLAVARAHADYHTERFGYAKPNVEFRDGYIERLDELERDSNIKAVVVRINSPGGTVAATQEVYQKL